MPFTVGGGSRDADGWVGGGVRLGCPLCGFCGRVVGVGGWGGRGGLCGLPGGLPYVGIVGEGDFRATFSEYRESRARGLESSGGSGLTPLMRR